ncbi:hypothetical protein TRVL_01144 [Trypanosoma vivax]|uniref:Sperm microtubule inner protein 1 C-terminal domain-containing protein n=1 Tax=Trypanosoma vivax (strain Y486) TaxID=1055687 RepID=G0TVG4_TRYVY|nr:hypothetical protein TRVL_01144 [Trypanosoma vivax]CCC47930.1 conserved hypothetical protein [Trypanosoma vivax Y486]
MPAKKKGPCPSVNPQLYEKSQKPSVTVAMGIKSGAVATACWRAQVETEQRIHARWAKQHDSGESARHIRALTRVLEREQEHLNVYQKDNEALRNILYKNEGADAPHATMAYLKARRELAPQEKYAKAPTASQELGWSVPEAMRRGAELYTGGHSGSNGLTQQSGAVYKRADDNDHAKLFGYTFDCSYNCRRV